MYYIDIHCPRMLLSFTNVRIDRVFVSPAERTMETASLFLAAYNNGSLGFSIYTF
jgi:phosphohistidine phosphatase SixA